MGRNSLRSRIALVLAGALLILSACGPAGGTQPTASPSAPQDPAASSGSASQTGSDMAGLEVAAKAEGQVTWYLPQLNLEQAEHVGAAFQKKYGIKVNIYRETSGKVLQRFTQEAEANIFQADVLGLTTLSATVDLKNKGYLLKYVPEGAAHLWEGYRNIDPEGYFHVVMAQNLIIIYNKNKVTAEQAPKSWQDLLDPKWKGQISSGHPAASGAGGAWATKLFLMYGADYFEKLAKQDLLIGQSGLEPLPRVATAERTIGIAPDGFTRGKIAEGDPLGMIYPEDGAVFAPNLGFIVTKAPHPNAAKLFQEYLFSVEMSEYLRSIGHFPIRKDVEPPAGTPSQVKLIGPTLKELDDNLQNVIDLWRRTTGV